MACRRTCCYFIVIYLLLKRREYTSTRTLQHWFAFVFLCKRAVKWIRPCGQGALAANDRLTAPTKFAFLHEQTLRRIAGEMEKREIWSPMSTRSLSLNNCTNIGKKEQKYRRKSDGGKPTKTTEKTNRRRIEQSSKQTYARLLFFIAISTHNCYSNSAGALCVGVRSRPAALYGHHRTAQLNTSRNWQENKWKTRNATSTVQFNGTVVADLPYHSNSFVSTLHLAQSLL